jgi:hypothetical protein
MEIGRLEGISRDEAADLRAHGIRTVEALEERVAKRGLAGAVRGRLVSAETVGAALGRHVLRERQGKAGPLLARTVHRARIHRPDALVAVLFVAAGFLLGRALDRPERSVLAKGDLAAFQVIGPGDVRVVRTASDFGTFATREDVVGRFPLQALPAGDPLRRDQLSRVRFTRPEELAGRRVVSLPAVPHALPLARPATRVALLLPPPAPGAAGPVVEDAIVLGARAAGDSSSLVVAVAEAALPALRTLGGGRVLVLQQVALPPTASDSAGRASPE